MSIMIQLHNLRRAHSEQVLITTFFKALTSTPTTLYAPTPEVLRTCFRLLGLFTPNSASTFLLTDSVTQDTLLTLDGAIFGLRNELQPHHVKLVDVWSMLEILLYSALGRIDGKVYEELYNTAYRSDS